MADGGDEAAALRIQVDHLWKLLTATRKEADELAAELHKVTRLYEGERDARREFGVERQDALDKARWLEAELAGERAKLETKLKMERAKVAEREYIVVVTKPGDMIYAPDRPVERVTNMGKAYNSLDRAREYIAWSQGPRLEQIKAEADQEAAEAGGWDELGKSNWSRMAYRIAREATYKILSREVGDWVEES